MELHGLSNDELLDYFIDKNPTLKIPHVEQKQHSSALPSIEEVKSRNRVSSVDLYWPDDAKKDEVLIDSFYLNRDIYGIALRTGLDVQQVKRIVKDYKSLLRIVKRRRNKHYMSRKLGAQHLAYIKEYLN